MEETWLKSYPPGVPHEIETEDISSIGDFLQESVAKFGTRRAFVSGATGKAITYQELDQLSLRFATHLQQMGLAPGSRIAMMMPNLLQYPVCQMGALRAGYVVVNVNPMYTPRELEHQLNDSGAQTIVILENFAHVLEKVIARTAVKHVLVTGVADMAPPHLRLLVNVVMKLKKLIPAFDLAGHTRLDRVLKAQPVAAFKSVSVRPSDVAFLQYTGGTTGVSKGAMLTHRNVLVNVRQCSVWTQPFIDPEVELLSITAIPIYHIFAMSASLNMMGFGGTNVLVADPRNTKAFVKVLAKYPFASLPAVNTLFNSLLNEPSFQKVNFSRLRLAMGGGAAIQRSVAERWKHVTGVPLCEGYGLTECSPTVTVNPFDITEYNGSIGLPLPSTEVSLRDKDGNEVGAGERGELCVRGPQVMAGYWNRPQETEKVMTSDGFLKTGDVATIDEMGFLRIVDRIKDLILVSGFNVYPNEIEDVVALMDGVLEVAAVGKADEASGEAVHLFVVKKDPSLTVENIQRHCREHLVGYKVPRQVHFVGELPKSPVGKILRRELRETLG